MRVLEHRFGYVLTSLILVMCALGAIGSLQFRAVSTWFPLFVSITGALLATVVLVVDLLGDRRARITGIEPETADPIESIELETGMIPTHDHLLEDDEPPSTILLSFARYLAWFVGFVCLFFLFGMPVSVLVWLFLFVRFAAKESWLRAALGAVIVTAVLFVLAATLALGLPEGLLIDSSAIIPSWRL